MSEAAQEGSADAAETERDAAHAELIARALDYALYDFLIATERQTDAKTVQNREDALAALQKAASAYGALASIQEGAGAYARMLTRT
ncbi:MAG TPA: hypothetical protein VGI39_01505 [Polyangiaceae bacterium]|jgi:hypothetical protein